MRLLLLALVAASALAQTITFAPQPFSRIPGLQEHRVYVAAPEGRSLQVPGMTVVVAALNQNIRVYSYPALAAYVADYNRRSPLRYVGIVLEVAGWAATSAAAGRTIIVNERWIAAGLPLLSAGLTLGRTYYDREYRPVVVPADLMPPLIAVPQGQSVDFAVWAAPPAAHR